MSTLNTNETMRLQVAQAAIRHALVYGFDPDDKLDPRNRNIKRGLENALSDIKTIVSMKGYYPPN